MGNQKSNGLLDNGYSPYTSYNNAEQTFEGLNLYGPLHGYYYHADDRRKAIENDEHGASHKIPYIFKYNATDFENILKPKAKQAASNNANNQPQKPTGHEIELQVEEKQHANEEEEKNANTTITDDAPADDEMIALKEYQKCRFEWIYIDPDDKAPYRAIDDISNGRLPAKYEAIRHYLEVNDPIPPHFLRKARMADKVLHDATGNSLCEVRELKCKIITRIVDTKSMVAAYHPGLLIWRRTEQFGNYSDDRGTLVHLKKLPPEFLSEEAKQQKRDEIEIECRAVTRSTLQHDQWDYKSCKEQELRLEHGLRDIAHWCLKYEMAQKYQYHTYSGNCRLFMIALCEAFGIEFDAEHWTDTVCYVAKKSKKIVELYKN